MDLTIIPDVPANPNRALFGYRDGALRLIRRLQGVKDPVTIGILGSWGSGKTSFLDILKANLKKEKKHVIVKFNAWQYTGEEHPVMALVASIAEQVQGDKTLKRLNSALRALVYGLNVKGKIGISQVAEMELGLSMKDVIEREGALLGSKIIESCVFDPVFRELEKAAKELSKEKRKVFVLIDDLDRAMPNKAVNLLEEIKLILNQPNFVIIMGLNPWVLNEFIVKKYRKKYGIKNFSIEQYIDKLIQVPYTLPAPNHEFDDYIDSMLRVSGIRSALATLGVPLKERKSQIGRIKEIIAVGSQKNPRAAKGLINRLSIRLRNSDRGIPQLLYEEAMANAAPVFFKEVSGNQFSADFVLLNRKNSQRIRGFLQSFAPGDKGEVALQLIALPEFEKFIGKTLEKLQDRGEASETECRLIVPSVLESPQGRDQLRSLVESYASYLRNPPTDLNIDPRAVLANLLKELRKVPFSSPFSELCVDLVRQVSHRLTRTCGPILRLLVEPDEGDVALLSAARALLDDGIRLLPMCSLKVKSLMLALSIELLIASARGNRADPEVLDEMFWRFYSRYLELLTAEVDDVAGQALFIANLGRLASQLWVVAGKASLALDQERKVDEYKEIGAGLLDQALELSRTKPGLNLVVNESSERARVRWGTQTGGFNLEPEGPPT